MVKKFLILMAMVLLVLAFNADLYAATILYGDGLVSKIGFSISSSAEEPDANTIRTLSSIYTVRDAYNASYLNNTDIGANSLMYAGELQPGTYALFFVYYNSVTFYYDDGSTSAGGSNYWAAWPVTGSSITLSDSESGRIRFNYTGTAWEVTKTAL